MENIIDVKADEFGERNVRMLAELDLKIVVSYLLLCDKDLTQAKLARELGITPAVAAIECRRCKSWKRYECKTDRSYR